MYILHDLLRSCCDAFYAYFLKVCDWIEKLFKHHDPFVNLYKTSKDLFLRMVSLPFRLLDQLLVGTLLPILEAAKETWLGLEHYESLKLYLFTDLRVNAITTAYESESQAHVSFNDTKQMKWSLWLLVRFYLLDRFMENNVAPACQHLLGHVVDVQMGAIRVCGDMIYAIICLSLRLFILMVKVACNIPPVAFAVGITEDIVLYLGITFLSMSVSSSKSTPIATARSISSTASSPNTSAWASRATVDTNAGTGTGDDEDVDDTLLQDLLSRLNELVIQKSKAKEPEDELVKRIEGGVLLATEIASKMYAKGKVIVSSATHDAGVNMNMGSNDIANFSGSTSRDSSSSSEKPEDDFSDKVSKTSSKFRKGVGRIINNITGTGTSTEKDFKKNQPIDPTIEKPNRISLRPQSN